MLLGEGVRISEEAAAAPLSTVARKYLDPTLAVTIIHANDN